MILREEASSLGKALAVLNAQSQRLGIFKANSKECKRVREQEQAGAQVTIRESLI